MMLWAIGPLHADPPAAKRLVGAALAAAEISLARIGAGAASRRTPGGRRRP